SAALRLSSHPGLAVRRGADVDPPRPRPSDPMLRRWLLQAPAIRHIAVVDPARQPARPATLHILFPSLGDRPRSTPSGRHPPQVAGKALPQPATHARAHRAAAQRLRMGSDGPDFPEFFGQFLENDRIVSTCSDWGRLPPVNFA